MGNHAMKVDAGERTSRRRLPLVVGLAATLYASPTAPAVGTPAARGERPVTANQFLEPRSHNSPALAVDPTDARFVVLANRLDAPDFGCALHVSGDGGGGFVPATPVPTLPPGAERCYAPEVGFDGDGVLYFLFVGLAGPGNVPMGVFLTSSSDRGRTFAAPRQVLGANNFSVRMAIDPEMGRRGRLHLVWLSANAPPGLGSLPPPPNPILSAYSDDGGVTFSAPVQVSDPRRAFVVAPALALGPDHSVHVLYYDLVDDARDYHNLEGPTWEGKWTLVLASSADGGRRFRRGVVIDDQIVPPERIMLIFTMPPAALAVDGAGRLFVAWHDARNGDWDVFLRGSGDGGRTWRPARRLNDDAAGNGRHQYQPRLAVAPTGRVDAVFYDRRDDTENLRNHVSYTFSVDAGRRFTSNRTLTAQPSDTRIGPSYAGPAAQGLVEFGSKIGLISLDDEAIAAWTDTRNATKPLHQDVFASLVEAPPGKATGSSRGRGMSAVAVAAAGATAAVLVVAWLRRRPGGGEPGARLR